MQGWISTIMRPKRGFFTFICYILALQLSANVQAKNGIYATLESGYSKQTQLPSAKRVGAHWTEATSIPSAFRAAIGYNHDLFECLGIGLDVGYGYYGKEIYVYSFHKTKVSSHSLEFLAFAQYHWNQWDIIGKIGGTRQTVIVTGQNQKDNQMQITPELSIGTAYNFNSHLAIIASYAHVFGQHISSFAKLRNRTPSINEILVGIRYSF